MANPSKRARAKVKPPLWKCPKCGAKLVTRNLWHACGRHSLKALFARSEPQVWRVLQQYVKLVRSIGPATVIPQKSRFVFMTRIRFAGGMPRKSYLDAHFLYPSLLRSPRITSSEKFPSCYVHRIHLRSPRDLDAQLLRWLRTAYRVGMQETM